MAYKSFIFKTLKLQTRTMIVETKIAIKEEGIFFEILGNAIKIKNDNNPIKSDCGLIVFIFLKNSTNFSIFPIGLAPLR
jgi:hypothetical protein